MALVEIVANVNRSVDLQADILTGFVKGLCAPKMKAINKTKFEHRYSLFDSWLHQYRYNCLQQHAQIVQ